MMTNILTCFPAITLNLRKSTQKTIALSRQWFKGKHWLLLFRCRKQLNCEHRVQMCQSVCHQCSSVRLRATDQWKRWCPDLHGHFHPVEKRPPYLTTSAPCSLAWSGSQTSQTKAPFYNKCVVMSRYDQPAMTPTRSVMWQRIHLPTKV